jgi:hypothetical protein
MIWIYFGFGFFLKIMQTLLCAIDLDLSKILKYLLYFNMY